MAEKRTSNNQSKRKYYYLSFLFDKIDVSQMVMVSFLNCDLFKDAIKEKIDQNITIDNMVVYHIIRDIYCSEKLNRDKGIRNKQVDLRRTRKGLYSLSEKLFNDRNYWQKECQEYIDKVAN